MKRGLSIIALLLSLFVAAYPSQAQFHGPYNIAPFTANTTGGTGCNTVGTSILKGNGTGGCANATGNTDYQSAIGGNTLAAHNFANSINAAGTLVGAQPSTNDISGAGTSITVNTGTSGATIPLLNAANTWSGVQTYTNSNLAELGSSTGATTLTSDNAGVSNFTLHIPAANDTITLNAASQTLTGKSIAGSEINSGLVAATVGGTGVASPTAHAIPIAEGASAFNLMAVCATGTFLYGQTGADPICSTLTLPNAATTGDVLYASGSNAIGRLADVAAGSYLLSGGVGAAPAWSTLTLPNAATTGDILYASGSNAIGRLADTASGKVLTSGGASTAPAYGFAAAALTTCSGSVTLSSGAGTVSLTTGCSTASSIPFCIDTTANNIFTATPGTNSVVISNGTGSDAITCVIVG